MTTFPIVDPVTGEVIAADEADRLQVIASALEDVALAAAAMHGWQHLDRQARHVISIAGSPNDVPQTVAGWTVAVESGRTPPRRVDIEAVSHHAEALAAIDAEHGLTLSPRMVESVQYPTVAQLTSTAARAALASHGIPVAAMLLTDISTPAPRVVIHPPKEV